MPCLKDLVRATGGGAAQVDMSAYALTFYRPTKAQRDADAQWVRCDAVLSGGPESLAPVPEGHRDRRSPAPYRRAQVPPRPDQGDANDPDLTLALTGPPGEIKIERDQSGWRIELDADLPRLDEGRYYQAWLRDDAGTLVPIGTFNDGDDVVLWAGVSPLEFTTFTVTRERADGNQESSGDRVLSGVIEE